MTGTALLRLDIAPVRCIYTIELYIDPDFRQVPTNPHFCCLPDCLTTTLSLRVSNWLHSFPMPPISDLIPSFMVNRVCSHFLLQPVSVSPNLAKKIIFADWVEKNGSRF